LLPNALAAVGRAWEPAHPDLIVGGCRSVAMESRQTLQTFTAKPPSAVTDFFSSRGIIMGQPSTFLSMKLMREAGGVREDLHCVMDWDLYLRATRLRSSGLRSAALAEVLSELADYPETKTQTQAARFREEAVSVLEALQPQLGASEQKRLRPWLRAVRNQKDICSILEQPSHRRRKLARLAGRSPSVLFSRFFWGALRRVR
jgi:hypothetical protein